MSVQHDPHGYGPLKYAAARPSCAPHLLVRAREQSRQFNFCSRPAPWRQGNASEARSYPETAQATSVMLKNIPNSVDPMTLVSALDRNYRGLYDYLYCPVDVESKHGVGYCFINFRSLQVCRRFKQEFHNVPAARLTGVHASKKVFEVAPARVQGQRANVDFLLQRGFLHEVQAVAPEWLPLVFDTHGTPSPLYPDPSVPEKTLRPRDRRRRLKRNDADHEVAGSDDEVPHVANDDAEEEHQIAFDHDTTQDDGNGAADVTTVMLRNIPNKLKPYMLVATLDKRYKGEYDYVYVPMDFQSKAGVGYCFINFRSPEVCQRFTQDFHGVAARKCMDLPPNGGFNTKKVCEVAPARLQGMEANVQKLRQGKVLDKVAKSDREWLPMVFDEYGDPSKVQPHNAVPHRSDQRPALERPRKRCRTGGDDAQALDHVPKQGDDMDPELASTGAAEDMDEPVACGWKLLWISEDAFKQVSKSCRDTLSSLSSDVHFYKSAVNAVRALEKKGALSHLVVIVSEKESRKLLDYIGRRDEDLVELHVIVQCTDVVQIDTDVSFLEAATFEDAVELASSILS
eukprot:TRINITY_DN80313_c0_g1_i1.p1 TRINITY_DN80313_c0_g1~~TRINITY_DN80313_c0_g1_i1.p1  ORF type:complete len:602 (+),score=47.45 TRINITY_DN80313_c0_g1_i1:99-1808(+)